MSRRQELLAQLQELGVDTSQLQGNVSPTTTPQQTSSPQMSFKDRAQDLLGNVNAGIAGANRRFGRTFGSKALQRDQAQSYEQALKTNPKSAKTGNFLAGLYKDIPLYLLASPLGPVGASGAASGLGNFLETPEEDETRTGNAVQGAIFGAGTAGLLKGANALPGAIKGLKKGFNKETIGKEIGETAKTVKSKYTHLYNNVLNKADELGLKTNLKLNREFITKSGRPRLSENIDKNLIEGLDKTALTPLRKAFRTNNPRDVHNAQSELFKFTRSKNSSGERPSRDAIKNANNLRTMLKKELNASLKKADPNLAKSYKDITKGYKEEVIPYTRNPSIRKYLDEDLGGADLTRRLQGNTVSGESFRKHLAKKHPEVKANKIKNIGLSTGAGALGLGTLYKLFDKAQE